MFRKSLERIPLRLGSKSQVLHKHMSSDHIQFSIVSKLIELLKEEGRKEDVICSYIITGYAKNVEENDELKVGMIYLFHHSHSGFADF